MKMNGPAITKFEEDIFARLNQVEREVAGQGAKLDAIQDSVERIARREERPIPWPSIGALVLGTLTFVMSIGSLALVGLSSDIKANEKSIDKVVAEVSKRTSMVYGTIEDTESHHRWLTDHSTRMNTLEDKVATLLAKESK